MSLRALCREMVVVKYQLEDAMDRDLRLAWLTANLTRAAKLPRLEHLKGPRTQSPKQHRRMLRILSEQHGIPLRTAHVH